MRSNENIMTSNWKYYAQQYKYYGRQYKYQMAGNFNWKDYARGNKNIMAE